MAPRIKIIGKTKLTVEQNFETNTDVLTHFYEPRSHIGDQGVTKACRSGSKRRYSFQNSLQKVSLVFTIVQRAILEFHKADKLLPMIRTGYREGDSDRSPVIELGDILHVH